MPIIDYQQRLLDKLDERGDVVPHQQTREPTITLDEHQSEAIDEIVEGLRINLDAFSIVHACGTGKSVLAATLTGASQDVYDEEQGKEYRDLLIGIDRSNVGRLSDELSHIGLDVGIWGDGRKQLQRPIIIASIQALQNVTRWSDLPKILGKVGLLIGDEADCYLTEDRQQVV